MAEPILSLSLSLLHANDVSREQKLCIHVHFMFETSVFFTQLSCIPIFSGMCSPLDACTAICLKRKEKTRTVSRQTGGERRKKVTQSEEANIIACLYFYILYKP